jgi:integrase
VQVIQQHITNAGIVDPDALVFTTQQGHCAITAAPKEITKALRKLGFNDTRTHDLRATAATAMTNSGASLVQVMHTLGHSTVDAAMRYQRATATAEREISLRIADRIVLPDNVLPLVRKAG